MNFNNEQSGYPFGIYLCECGILFIWYPDSKKDPSLNFFPEIVKCECGLDVAITEKLRIKDIWSELVPFFIQTSNKYKFKKLMMIDEKHVHLVWQTGKEFTDI
ncbi:MAG: hypothetical protein ACFFDN_43655 [Candidatus Hodarchaeota archaeon]